jgi:hypothetical protein
LNLISLIKGYRKFYRDYEKLIRGVSNKTYIIGGIELTAENNNNPLMYTISKISKKGVALLKNLMNNAQDKNKN